MTEKEKLTIVVFSGELDRALAAFNLAATGASMGMSSWGLRRGVGKPGFMSERHTIEHKLWRERMGVEPTEDIVNAPQRI